jgi:hypothetical protein
MPTSNLFVDERDTKERTPELIIEEIMLSFFTPDRPGAGTDATVCLQIGPKKFLLGDKAPKSSAQGSDKNHFEGGDYDTFFLNQVNLPLADLRQAAIRLSHDGSGFASDWYAGRFELFVRFVGEEGFKTYKFWPAPEWITAKNDVLLQPGMA